MPGDAFILIGGGMKSFWDWMGTNSGQIQIIIALVAFWLAYLGYKKVLKQINMAEEQSAESEKQTKHFAEQVKEAAKQTGFAAKQFETSNLQTQEIIGHRNLVLDIRTEELKFECIDMCAKAILTIQKTELVLKRGISVSAGRMSIFVIPQNILDWINLNVNNMNNEINDLRVKSKELIDISGKLATNSNSLTRDELYESLMTIKLIYLRSIRSEYTYAEFTTELIKLYPLP
ncbi:hypothetical protein [Acinetobacter sp. IK40]|uniref:hypothetical protein n=1 Tax=Acinetobacter sp. IK40 TaxID=2928897 RepID=UPI002D1EEA27|nr:hypothetical protein [Acinetobacter sp. IK40]MEB3790142.1 hypothetical protein [Acinetobacter sp. IK40]